MGKETIFSDIGRIRWIFLILDIVNEQSKGKSADFLFNNQMLNQLIYYYEKVCFSLNLAISLNFENASKFWNYESSEKSAD